jgi:DNA-binding GntR family transcriptional regulator
VRGLREKAVDVLRDQILGGHLRAGELIQERDLAAKLEMSKTPVREALALLCEEGLVQLFPRRGYLVRPLTIEDALDTFDLRLILEGAASERAATRISDEQLAKLRDLARYDCCTASNGREHNGDALTHSFDFHVLIAKASGNAALAAQIEKLLRDARRITAIGFTYGEHDRIVDALEARDGAKARRAMEDHIGSGRQAAMAALAGNSVHRLPLN